MAKRQSMRDRMKDELGSRTKESHSRRDESGGMKTFFDPEKMTNVVTWWAGKGDHIIDIIPYLAGSKDPRNKENAPAYLLDIDVHRYVGPMDEMVVCLEQYDKPCPICEESRRLNRAGADWKKEIKPLKPSRRAVYNVVVRDGGEMEKKGVQVFEIAHWFMEKHLAKIAKDPRGGGFTVFSDPDDGKSISFERTGVGMENTGYTGHQFVARPEPITDEELESAYCIDDLVEIKSYDEIYDLFFGTGETDESPDKEKSSKVDKSNEDADEEFEEVEEEEEEEEEEKEVEKEKISKRELRKKNRKKDKEVAVCPHGGVIGEDIDELDECDECKLYDTCSDIADNL